MVPQIFLFMARVEVCILPSLGRGGIGWGRKKFPKHVRNDKWKCIVCEIIYFYPLPYPPRWRGNNSGYIFYNNCSAILGLWFAVANKVALACCNIWYLIYALDSSDISASRNVERDDTKFSY